MQIREREEQILRIRTTSFQPELSAALELKLRQAVVGVTKATLESALVEELAAVHIHLTSAGIHTQLRQLSHRQLRQGENGRVMKEIIG